MIRSARCEGLEGIGMGHYCRICGRQRPNEQFSGKGHRIHVCKRCQAKPKSERRTIENMDEITGFMRQSHISEKNVVRLEQMVEVGECARRQSSRNCSESRAGEAT